MTTMSQRREDICIEQLLQALVTAYFRLGCQHNPSAPDRRGNIILPVLIKIDWRLSFAL